MEPHLLEKYWNGETTLEEEARIMEEMLNADKGEATYFAMINAARQQKSSLTPDDIKRHAEENKTSNTSRVLPLYRLLASAAAILLFLTISIGLWQYTQKAMPASQMAETYDDPQKAYEEVRNALAFVSMKLNKSQNEALVNIQKAGTYADMFK